MSGDVGVFVRKTFCDVGGDVENNGGEKMVVVAFVPPSDGEFTFCEDVFEELFEFGDSVSLSCDHAILGGSNVPVAVDVGVVWWEWWEDIVVGQNLM